MAIKCGPESGISRSCKFGLRVVLSKAFLGVSTNRQGFKPPTHGFHLLSLVREGAQKNESDVEFIDRVARSDDEKRLFRLCEIREAPFPITKDSPLQFVASDFSKRNISSEDFKIIIQTIAPAFKVPEDFYFYGKQVTRDGQFSLQSNLNLQELRRVLVVPRETPIGFADLMALYLHARTQMASCALHGCDFDADEMVSRVFRSRLNEVVQKVAKSQDGIQLFQENTFPDGRRISEAIDHGHRSMKDFLLVLEKAKKFKKFLHQIQGDPSLIREYIASNSSAGWLENLPAKHARFVLFTGGGFLFDILGGAGVGTLAALGLSAFDTYLLEKIVRNWRPNQFVDDSVRPFLSY